MIEEDHGCEITCNFCGERNINSARKSFWSWKGLWMHMPNNSWKIRDIVIPNQVVIAPMAGDIQSCLSCNLQGIWCRSYLYRDGFG